MGRPKGIPMSEEQKELRRQLFRGNRNPFYGKKHSDETKQLMSEHHADFNGEKNPFKKSLNDEKVKVHKKRCQKIWANRDESYRKNFGKKIQKGHEEISGTFWARIKSNAKQKNRLVDVTIKDCWEIFLKQNRQCALSGIELVFSNKFNETTASLDRIDCSKDYIDGNVQWVHKTINLMKRTLSDEQFIEFCQQVSEHQKGRTNVITGTRKEEVNSSA